MRESDGKRKFIGIYTLVFAALSLTICVWFFVSKKTFVWTGDGWLQHYRAYLYYAEYIRTIFHNLFVEHQFLIPHWEFAIGEGADILETLNYYVIGDPFSFFAFLFPESHMYIYYGLAIFARLYVAGIVFSAFCFYLGHKNRYGILAGALSYVFCYWCVINLLRHPFFLNPMIYLPLILLGMEMMLRQKRFVVLTVAVMLSAMSNFYFFYMLVLLSALYVLIRLLFMKRIGGAEKLRMVGRIFLAALLGLALSAIVFLPVAATFLADARMDVQTTYHLFYPILYYSRLVGTFVSAGGTYAMFMGYSAPVLLAVILLLRKKGYGILKTFLCIGLIFTLFPIFGQILNGFSYMTNRWCFALALVACYTLTAMWEDLIHLSAADGMRLLAGVAVYGLLCFLLEYSRTARAYEAIGLALAGVILLLPLDEAQTHLTIERKQWGIVVLVGLSVICTVFNKYAYNGSDYLSESAEVADIKEINSNETTAVSQRGEPGFWRYAGSGLTLNGNITSGLSSAAYYWTLSNPYVAQLRQMLDLPDANSFNYNGYDDRTVLNTLSAVKYYVTERADNAPYGYGNGSEHRVDDVSYWVYENADALPAAYGYDGYIKKSDWDRLTFLEKQEALMQGVVIDDDTDFDLDVQEAAVTLSSEAVDYQITPEGKGVAVSDHAFTVTKPGGTVTLTLQGKPRCETYLSFQGLELEASSYYDLYVKEGADPNNTHNKKKWEELPYSKRQEYYMEDLFGEAVEYSLIDIAAAADGGDILAQKGLMVFTKDYNHYDGRGDYAVNLKYHEDGVASVTLTFDEMGIYSFDSLSILCQPMETYDAALRKRSSQALSDITVGTDEITGRVMAQKDELVLFAVPYAKGWTATVDGQEARTLRANVMYMAVPVEQGEHEIRLAYENPYLKYGACITLAAAAVFLAVGTLYRKKSGKKAS